MPWWAARGLLYIIVAFLLAAGLWAHFSVLDIVSEARGTLLPEATPDVSKPRRMASCSSSLSGR